MADTIPNPAGEPAGAAPNAVPSGAKPAVPRAAPLPTQPLAQPTRPLSQPARPVAARPVPVKGKTQAGELPDDRAEEEAGADELTRVLRRAPPWLVSTVFHALVLIVMGLIAIATSSKPELELEAIVERFAEQLGDQLDDPGAIATSDPTPDAKEQVISPSTLPPVENPLAAPPEVADLAAEGTVASSDIKAPTIGMALNGREAGMKSVLLGAYGGNATTEQAVMRGLAWLIKNQQQDGMWSLRGPYADGSLVEENREAATGLALLAFQGAGITHQKGKYAAQVLKAWDALLAKQDADGGFFHGERDHSRLYTQAICSIAVCEMYGMTGDKKFLAPAQKAVNFAVKYQDRAGGWRYTLGEESDTSVTGWFVMALKSARMAKLEVPEEVFSNISKYLDSASEKGGREYLYQPNMFGTPAMTAEGLLCRQYLGWKQTDPRLLEGVAALNKDKVDYASRDRDVYYWYYATQACHHMENPIVGGQRHFIWKEWNDVMKQEVPAHQIRKGPEEGSWDPQGDKFADNGGRLYVTCLSIYMLEVYYRHLPIYSAEKFMSVK